MAGWGTMRQGVEHTHMLRSMSSHLSFPNVLISEIYIRYLLISEIYMPYVSPCYRWLTTPPLSVPLSLSRARSLSPSLALSTFGMLSLSSQQAQTLEVEIR